LIAFVDGDVWGKPYKIVMRRLGRFKQIPRIELPGRVANIVSALFPDIAAELGHLESQDEGTIPQVSIEELVASASSLPSRKAPGLDKLPNEFIKAVATLEPQYFCRLFNSCLEEEAFPARWKRAKLVLLLKPGKPLDSPAAYRPICLLDGCGKLLEKLIVSRLRQYWSATPPWPTANTGLGQDGLPKTLWRN